VQVKLQVELKWRRGGGFGGMGAPNNPISWLRGGFQRVFSSQSSQSVNAVKMTMNSTTDPVDEISLPVEATVSVWVDGNIPMKGIVARRVSPITRLVPFVGTVAASSAMKALAPILGNLLVSDYLSRRKSLMQEQEIETLDINGESI